MGSMRIISLAEQQVIDEFKATDCYKQICDAVNIYEADDAEAMNVGCKDRILMACTKGGNVQTRRLHVKQVAALQTNRGGEGLMWQRAHSTAYKIKLAGYSVPAISENAWTVEDNPFTREIAMWMEKICASSDHYANYSAADIVCGNLGATHATHGVACVYDEVRCELENISVKGRMNREKVFARDEQYKEACMVGIEYRMVRWYVAAACPKAMSIVSEALNTVSQIAEGTNQRITIIHDNIYAFFL